MRAGAAEPDHLETLIGLSLGRLYVQGLAAAALLGAGAVLVWHAGVWPLVREPDWDYGVAGVLMVVGGLWIAGCVFAIGIVRLRAPHALRLGRDGVSHFVGGTLAWDQLGRVDIETSTQKHTQRVLLWEHETTTTTRSLRIWLQPQAYRDLRARLNFFDRLFLSPAIRFDDDNCVLLLPEDAMDCEPQQLMKQMNSMRRLLTGRGKA